MRSRNLKREWIRQGFSSHTQNRKVFKGRLTLFKHDKERKNSCYCGCRYSSNVDNLWNSSSDNDEVLRMKGRKISEEEFNEVMLDVEDLIGKETFDKMLNSTNEDRIAWADDFNKNFKGLIPAIMKGKKSSARKLDNLGKVVGFPLEAPEDVI